MQEITELAREAKQQITVITNDGTSVELYFEFKDTQIGWFYDVKIGSFEAKGLRLCSSPNSLRNFRNIINVGLAVTVADKTEPFFLDDFVTSRVRVFLLDSNEVSAIEEQYYGG